MKLTIIVPCFNEEKTIKTVIEKVLSLKVKKIQVIVVDDCSSDNSYEIINSIKNDNLLILQNQKNLGKGAAINTAKKYVDGDIVAIQTLI